MSVVRERSVLTRPLKKAIAHACRYFVEWILVQTNRQRLIQLIKHFTSVCCAFTVNFTHHNTYPPTLKFYGKSARKNIFMHYRSHPPSSMKTSCIINERNRIAEHQMKLIVRLNFKNLNLHLHSMVILTLLSTNLKTSIIGTISTMITTKKTVTITFI